ncbi:MAG: nitroreductase family protein [Pseudomonadales bacterium]
MAHFDSSPAAGDGATQAFDLAAVDEILSTARSVRRKLDFERPMDEQELLDCINVATQAPVGLGGENWRFVVATQSPQKQAIAQIYRNVLEEIQQRHGLALKPTQHALADRLHEIPAMILVCVEGQPADQETHSQVGFYGSILPAAWSLMLALRARNIGCTWTSLLASRPTEVAQALGIPGAVTQTVMLPIGYTKGAVLRRAKRRDAAEITYWNRWGNTCGDTNDP